MPSRLPIRIRPAADEIAVSYLNRLATLHEIPFPELWPQVSRPRNGVTRRLDADLLAAVADQPRERLARAVIELRAPEPDWLAVRHEPQRGCWRCNAAHPGGRVLQLLGHHRYACTRHRVWIGPPDLTDHPQPDLAPLPEIVAAQHVHLRLLRRIGPAATFGAVLTGFLICAHRWNSRHDPTPTDARHHWARRAETLIPPGTETLTFSASRLFAATYPEAVSIAEMIGTLHWRRLAAGDPDAQRRFATAIGRRLGQPDYRPGIVNDPIAHWIDQDCWRPPSLPSNDYRSLRTFGGHSFRKPHKNIDETRFTSAHWFALHRRGGDTMLHHRTLAPVILRDWSAPLTLFESAIDATANVSRGTWSKLDHRHGTMPSTCIRPAPAPSDYLDTATEPAAWPQRAQPRSNFNPRPWSPSERPYFVHRKRH
jgi:hypothetical protein